MLALAPTVSVHQWIDKVARSAERHGTISSLVGPAKTQRGSKRNQLRTRTLVSDASRTPSMERVREEGVRGSSIGKNRMVSGFARRSATGITSSCGRSIMANNGTMTPSTTSGTSAPNSIPMQLQTGMKTVTIVTICQCLPQRCLSFPPPCQQYLQRLNLLETPPHRT